MASTVNNLAGGTQDARSFGGGSLDQVLRRASVETGVDFKYLLQTAERESSLNPSLKAKTSSATGLFQFIEQTWLATLKSNGAEFGLGRQAQQIEQSPDGRFFVRDAAKRQEILDLRKDPEISAKLAGALTQDNADYLKQITGREPTGGELYIAHFLGARGAVDLIEAKASQPDRFAADLFPRAAEANRPIFYFENGEERSVGEVYTLLTNRHENSTGQRVLPPDPENTLASHTREEAIPSRYLASGPQAAFLAGHFGGATNAFSPENESGEGTFGAVFGKSNASEQKPFFAPQVTPNQGGFSAYQRDANVIPSRYGRVEEGLSATITSSPLPNVSVPPEVVDVPRSNDPSSNEDVLVSPSIAGQDKTVVIRSSEFGKTDLPLDLSHYLKVPLK